MNLFIDTISSPAKIIIFDDNRNIISDFSWEASMRESSTLVPSISSLLDNNSISFSDINNIVVVNWPWSFTWVRTTTLVANTISYLDNKINLTEISFFDLYDNYPIIKKSSRRDCFCKFSIDDEIKVIKNTDLSLMNLGNYYWDFVDFIDAKNISKVDYWQVLSKINLDNLKLVKPFYFKKPNIT